MCGIVAIYRPDRGAINPDLLDRMTDRLIHRGPDGRGTFRAPGIGLGHRRLAIIDVEGGQQPLHGADPRVVVTFNGEVFNYREMKGSLPGPWRTASDTEVFLRAYETQGVAGLQDLVGMWGAAIWDGRDESLVVVRDRLGVKPVYHAPLPGGGHAFASELRALLELPEVSTELDHEALEQLLTYRYVPAPRTLLSGIRKLLPGEVVRVGRQGLTSQCYWSPVPKPDPMSDAEAEETFLGLFDQAVNAHLVSDVPVGLFLSGGVDSAALLQAMGRGVHCFTIGFQGESADDEIPLAAETCRRFGAVHHTTVIGPRDYTDTFDTYVRCIEEPVLNDSAMATYFLAGLARTHVKVVLSGQGADEPLAGYDRFKGEALAPWYQQLPNSPKLSGWLERSRAPEKVKRAARALGETDDIRRARRIYAVLQEEDKTALMRPEARRPDCVDEPLTRLHSQVPHLSALGRMLYTDTRLWLPDDLLLVADKLSMAHGLEFRVPFLDHRLVERLESMPDAQKLRFTRRGFVTKAVHRRAMLRRLPASVLQRKKRGFNNPMGTWLRGPLRSMLQARLLDPGSPLLAWARPEALAQIVQQHVLGTQDHRRTLFLLLTIDAWMRLVRDRAL